MSSTSAGDAERLQSILELERAIAGKQPALRVARAEQDATKSTETERRQALATVDKSIAALRWEVHQQCTAVYLNGRRLDRGRLDLGNEVVRFSGWRGRIDVPLRDIEEVSLGSSHLPPRSGVPFLSWLTPGQPRSGETLLLIVRTGDGTDRSLAVIADMRDASGWREAIHAGQARLGAVAARRGELEAARTQASAVLADATHALVLAQGRLDVITKEISTLQRQRDRLKSQQRAIDKAREREVRAARDAYRKWGKK